MHLIKLLNYRYQAEIEPAPGKSDGSGSNTLLVAYYCNVVDPKKKEHFFYLIGPDIEETAGGIIRPGGEGVPIREELKQQNS